MVSLMKPLWVLRISPFDFLLPFSVLLDLMSFLAAALLLFIFKQGGREMEKREREAENPRKTLK